jgi:hypothetical protein
MKKEDLKKFREHYFSGNITESRSKMCSQFSEYKLNERCVRAWESGQNTVGSWFIKVAGDFDKDNILKDN